MASKETRYCARDDVEVRQIRQGDPTVTEMFGKGATPQGSFYHVGGNGRCGRQFLTENDTYTEGISDESPFPSEPQL